MVQIVICYIAFLVIGFVGGLVCPYDSKITGYANDYIGGGFVYSYRHDHDPTELLLFISVPIIIVAIIILIVKTKYDKENAPSEERIKNKNSVGNMTLEEQEKDASERWERAEKQLVRISGFVFFIIIVSAVVSDNPDPVLLIGTIGGVTILCTVFNYLFCKSKYKKLEKIINEEKENK